MLRVAVILSDTLQSVGLATLLERYFAPVEVKLYASAADLQQEGGTFDRYFTDATAFAAGVDFFLTRRSQTVILTSRQTAVTDSATDSFRILRTGEPLEELADALEPLLADKSSAHEPASDELSAREVQVLQLIVTGAINKEIADRLNISLNTVLTHRKNITAKLGIKTISGLTLYALMHGYISSDDISL